MTRDDPQRAHGLVPAFRELTDGVVSLVRQHIELVKVEVREDARAIGKNGSMAAAAGMVALLGWGFFLLGMVMLGWWLGGALWGFIVATGIGLLHLGAGAALGIPALRRIKKAEIGMNATTAELERDSQWVKQISNNS